MLGSLALKTEAAGCGWGWCSSEITGCLAAMSGVDSWVVLLTAKEPASSCASKCQGA